MLKENPKTTELFLKEIKSQESEIIDIDGVMIKTRRNVFPPKSNFSHSSERLHEVFGDLHGLRVLDVGTGTGVQAIQAIKSGAKEVVAVDINKEAVACAKENIILNKVEDRVSVFESDLFSSLPKDKAFDLVIANLPITNYPAEGIAELALYDPGYVIHQRFLSEVGLHLHKNGAIIMTHINFEGENDFNNFELLLSEHGYKPERYFEISDIGYLWRMYRIVAI